MIKTYTLYAFLLLLLHPSSDSYAQSLGKNYGDHSMVTDVTGKLYTWGYNYDGQLGLGTSGVNTHTRIPLLVGGALADKTVISVSGGYMYSMALTSTGVLYAWGRNSHGQLGTGNVINYTTSVPVPVKTSGVLLNKTIIQVSAGPLHCLALDAQGKVYAWGDGDSGQLGDGLNQDTNEPVSVQGLLNSKVVTQIAAGDGFSMALDSDGKVYTWGYGPNGCLGNGSNSSQGTPVAVSTAGVLNNKTITRIAAGSSHAVVVDTDGKVYTWGLNNFGQLGNETYTTSNVPVNVAERIGAMQGKTITKISANGNTTLVLTSDNLLFSWGSNTVGQLGYGSNFYANLNTPVLVQRNVALSGKTISHLGAGLDHFLVMDTDGMLYSWGRNTYGQLGDSSVTNRYDPVAVYQNILGPLPVELTTFSAAVSGKNVVLNWGTATEISNYGFDIERSSDKSSWSKIGFVPGNGNSNSTKQYSYTDNPGSANGKIYYRLKQLDTDGKYEYSKILEVNLGTPAEFALNQNYPNPFNPSTTISFSVPVGGYVSLAIFNLLGEKIAEPINKALDAGNYTVDFDASGLSSGLYFYTLKAGEYTAVKKMVLTK